jgi:LacI family transcriptional regulator
MIERSERIRAVAQRLGYKPNAAARSMRSHRFSSIGYFVATPEGEGVSHQEDQIGVCHGANQHEYHVSLIHLPIASTDPNLSSIPRALQEACIDALIVANFMALPLTIKESIRASRLPVVYLNESDPVNAVKIDDLQGACTMTRHLIGQGFRDIAFLEMKTTRSLPIHYSFVERRAGYSATMREAGLKERIVVCENADYRTVIKDLLVSKNRPDAIFCDEDLVAMMVQRVALHEGISAAILRK